MNDDRTRIERVYAMQKTTTGLGMRMEFARREVIESIKQSDNWFTCTGTKKSYYKKGEEIHILLVRGEEFIRTDRYLTPKDNLGSLPDC
jgi:hypothetical protein